MENLNKDQFKAVTTTEGPLLIISGPGSGKTKTLVERAVYLLTEKGVRPENIFLSTFTDKASNELIVRISDRIKEKGLKININNMYIGTLHSIFLRLIDENIEFSLFEDGYRVLDEIDQIFFIYSKIKYFNQLDGYKEFFKEIPATTSWDRSKKLTFWLNKINEEGKRLDKIITDDKKILFLKEAHKLYHKLLIENNVIDFTTIQRELYRLLFNNDEVLNQLKEKINYIMIDEYQDTNTIQEKIIFLIGEGKNNICVVGDDDQGIYRFRGASIKNILQFPTRFDIGQCNIINLNINYRSHKDIIKFCNRWISLINWKGYRFEKNIEPPENKIFFDTPAVLRLGGDSENKWKENILKFIKKLVSTQKISDYSQIAFLFKSVQFPIVKELKKYLEESNIPIYSPRSKDFFDREEIKLLIGAFLVYFPQNKYIVLDEVQNRKNHIFYYYKDCLNLLKKQIQNDEKLYKWLFEIRKYNMNDELENYPSFKEIFYQLLQFDTFKKIIHLENKEIKDNLSSYNLGIFTEILEKFEILTNIEKINKIDIDKVLKYFFMVYLNQLFLKKIDEYENKEEFPKGAIPFLTFHQAKGLEFPIVIVGSLDSSPKEKFKTEEDYLEDILKLNDNFEPEDKKNIFDFWRVYYTAFSRAQDLLILTSIENRSGKNELPSRTFRPIYESIPYVNSDTFHLEKVRISPLKEGNNREVLSYTSHILLYEFCPLKYRFLKKFKFKPLKNSDTFYGILAHKLIEKINRDLISFKNKEILSNELPSIIDSYSNRLQKNLRTLFTDEIKEKLKKDLQIYLEKTEPKSLIASEIKAFKITEDYIIEGTIDLLKRNEDKIHLIDFKTGKFESEKFQLYKRQLEIYAYLIKELYPDEELELYLQYIDENNTLKIESNSEDAKKAIMKFDKIAKKLLANDFLPRKFDEKCEKCEFKWFCKNNDEVTNETKL